MKLSLRPYSATFTFHSHFVYSGETMWVGSFNVSNPVSDVEATTERGKPTDFYRIHIDNSDLHSLRGWCLRMKELSRRLALCGILIALSLLTPAILTKG